MIPIHELLNRIRWDERYGAADFTIGYYDRLEGEIIRVAVGEMLFDKDDRFDFQFIDESGVLHTVPLHRIKQVFKDGQLIWERTH